jgi:tetratricopeptide (TPR) repeat protein
MAHISREEHAQAVPILQAVLAENPRMVDGWENLAQSLQRLGRREEALAAYEKAMELSGGVGHVAIGAASVLLDLGRLDEAQKHAELGLETGPAAAHSLLAQIAIQRGDLGQAEKEARAALASRGSRVGPLVTLAQVLQKQEKLDAALQTTDQAVEELSHMEGRRRFTGLFFVRGDLLARLGRTAEAEQAFLHEIEDYPANYKAYSRLAVLYAAEGRNQETVGILRRMVERESSPGAYAEAIRTLRVVGDPQGADRLLGYALSLFPKNQELRSLAG